MTGTSLYASDPESGPRRKHVEDAFSGNATPASRRHFRRPGRRRSRSLERAKTASWQDLFNLVTLQTCIQDTRNSLEGVIRRIDKSVLDDVGTQLTYQANEKQTRVDDLHRNLHSLRELCSEREGTISARRELLTQRRETLRLAVAQIREGDTQLAALGQSEVEERSRLDSLRRRITPTRTTLLSVLAGIFPIELRSSPDLLFTIVDVPLPIPLASTDPAPPLALAAHKDINEDAVATALGYAALLVQFVAMYLGRALVYPVTFVGSRSLIRDGISAMVGPRMFPLFSKGVDTYRFEYGVFLLNKDIELLMAEKELRALDMRHTLPNLKNLLLTITNGDSVYAGPSRPSNSSTLSVSGLESPRPVSPAGDSEESPTTPKAADASGTTTPTATTAEKKGRSAFMNMNVSLNSLSGLGFLGLRRSPNPRSMEGNINGEDDDDRRTLRGGEVGGDGEAEADGQALREDTQELDVSAGTSAGREEKVIGVVTAPAAAVS